MRVTPSFKLRLGSSNGTISNHRGAQELPESSDVPGTLASYQLQQLACQVSLTKTQVFRLAGTTDICSF